MHLHGENFYSHLIEKLPENDQIDITFMFMKQIDTTMGCLPLSRNYKHVSDHYFQNISSPKSLGQLKPNLMWSLQKFKLLPRSHGQDSRHTHAPSIKIPLILKLGMGQVSFFESSENIQQKGRGPYCQVLTYFTARSDLIAQCVYMITLSESHLIGN